MKFLRLEQVLDLQYGMIEKYGGLQGIRDLNLLKSSIEMPKSMMFGEYLHPTIYDKAAAYLYHIACNHPFVDGNKRTASACALIFLSMNNVSLNINQESYEELILDVAKGKANKELISKFFQTRLSSKNKNLKEI